MVACFWFASVGVEDRDGGGFGFVCRVKGHRSQDVVDEDLSRVHVLGEVSPLDVLEDKLVCGLIQLGLPVLLGVEGVQALLYLFLGRRVVVRVVELVKLCRV